MKRFIVVLLVLSAFILLVSCSSKDSLQTDTLSHTPAACQQDSDCVPSPSSCHPTTCVNSFAAAILPKVINCSIGFERNAVYQSTDCVCVQNNCVNKKLLNGASAETVYVNLSSSYKVFDTPKDCVAKSLICDSGMIPYVNESGCGCKPSIVSIGDSVLFVTLNKTIGNLTEHVCSSTSKQKDLCIQVFSPVCGWFDKDVLGCTGSDCMRVFSNACEACKQQDVVFWTDGECPVLLD